MSEVFILLHMYMHLVQWYMHTSLCETFIPMRGTFFPVIAMAVVEVPLNVKWQKVLHKGDKLAVIAKCVQPQPSSLHSVIDGEVASPRSVR